MCGLLHFWTVIDCRFRQWRERWSWASFQNSRLLHHFGPIRRFLWEDFNPLWGFDCKHYFIVKNIDDSHDNLAIDYDGFALGTDESFNDCEPPVFWGCLFASCYLGHGN